MNSYKTIDFTKTKIPDCLVKYNKIGNGSGEAKLYVGGSTLKDWLSFFENFNIKSFFKKEDLKKYLESVEFEYKNPSQGYRNDIRNSWFEYFQKLNNYNDTIYFDIYHKEYNNKNRFYIQSNDEIYDFFRKIALPNITSLLIQKILINNEIQLWFRLYLNDIGNDFEKEIADENIEQIINDKTINETEKNTLIKSRIGQGNYRDLIIRKYKTCVITGIDDERILIASHIKPWIVSNNYERINQQNGLLLSPTYDKLFDKGFISFKDNGKIILSNHFSDINYKKVNLSVNDKFDIKITEEMKLFLEYHRDMRFLK